MTFFYCKRAQKYISRKLAMEKLGLRPKQFDKLVVLLCVYPVVPVNKQRVDKVVGFYYKVSDIEVIANSDAYAVLKKNLEIDERRQKYIERELEDKLRNLKDEEYGFTDLIKHKYRSFCECLVDLRPTLNSLYLAKQLNLNSEIFIILNTWESFISSKKMLNKAFMSKKGIYFQASIEKLEVFWFVPYPGKNLSEIVEEKKDSEEKFRWSSLNFLDFVSESEEDDSDDESSDVTDMNDPNKMDVSLLKYSLPLNIAHLKLALHKLQLMYKDKVASMCIFANMSFAVDTVTIDRETTFVIISCGGNIVSDDSFAEYCVTESVNEMKEDVKYVQPQYVFDCLNSGCLLSVGDYLIGRKLPVHASPFKNSTNTVSGDVLRLLSNKKRQLVLDILNEHNETD